MFQPTSNITEQIADHLTWEIVTGRLPDRARIQELKLAKELDVSRGSVREALLLLQGRHLVEIVPRKGASVRPLDQQDIEPFGELFADLLARALRRVKLTPGERDLALLEPICMAAKQGETEALIRERQRVLRELAGRSNDRYLLSVLDPLFATAGRIAFVATRHR